MTKSDERFTPNRPVGLASQAAYELRRINGFWEHFCAGPHIIDVGYRGGTNAQVICEGALGIERGTPGYDGLHIPVEDGWADAVHCSHVLEHVLPPEIYLQEWFRTLRLGGFLLLFLPHAFLYERRLTVPPSRFSPEHLRSYTPSTLLAEIEWALEPNTYRVRHLADMDYRYDYSLPLEVHPVGAFEIECVIQKVTPPAWKVDP